MYDSKILSELAIPIRLEDINGAGIIGKVSGNLTVTKAAPSNLTYITVTLRTLTELGGGDYTLRINKSIITEPGFFRVKVLCESAEDKQYVSNILPTNFNVYFKSTGHDANGDGSFDLPYQSLSQCLTHINGRPGFTIHVLDGPANVAGNKDQLIGFPVRVKGYGFPWTITPTTYHIATSTSTNDIILEDLHNIKINLDASTQAPELINCHNVSIVSGGFSEHGIYQDCTFSAAITGAGTGFGNRSKWIRCIFRENVDIAITLDGGIFKDCVFEKDLNCGVSKFTVFDNCVIHGVLTGPDNGAFAGQVVFKNPYVNNNATVNGKKYIFMGGIIRGALTLEVNSIDCVIWGTRVKGGFTDDGTTNEIINKAAWAVPADKMDLLDTLKHKAGAAGYDRTTDSLEAIGEKAQGIIDKATYKNLIFNRQVLTRHPAGPGEGKPKTTGVGTAGAEGSITTTVDGDGHLDTEAIS